MYYYSIEPVILDTGKVVFTGRSFILWTKLWRVFNFKLSLRCCHDYYGNATIVIRKHKSMCKVNVIFHQKIHKRISFFFLYSIFQSCQNHNRYLLVFIHHCRWSYISVNIITILDNKKMIQNYMTIKFS